MSLVGLRTNLSNYEYYNLPINCVTLYNLELSGKLFDLFSKLKQVFLCRKTKSISQIFGFVSGKKKKTILAGIFSYIPISYFYFSATCELLLYVFRLE